LVFLAFDDVITKWGEFSSLLSDLCKGGWWNVSILAVAAREKGLSILCLLTSLYSKLKGLLVTFPSL
jgi:hypothetical protein